MNHAAVRFVAWSLVLSVVCAGLYFLLFPLPLTAMHRPMPAASKWLFEHIPGWTYSILTRLLSSVAIFSFFAAMTAALVAGPRGLRAGATRRGTVLILGGLLLATLSCGGPLLWYARSRRSLEATQVQGRTVMAELGARLESGSVPDAQREKLWQIYAGSRYRDEGVKVLIPDASGHRIEYEPSESDISGRRSYLKLLDDLEPPTGHLKGSALWVGLCLAVGLLTPLRWPGKPAGAPPAGDVNPGTGTLAEE